ncbi:MAG: peptide chain release factor 2 [Alphaproteobacteria bacterium]|nr:peptide chain release factor 2 [Alphaproteobacteria bacterium]
MKSEIKNLIVEVEKSIDVFRRHLDFDNAIKRVKELEEESLNPNFWNDNDNAQKVMSEKSYLESSIQDIQEIDKSLRDSIELIELGELEQEDDIVLEAEQSLNSLKEYCDKKQLETLLSGEADKNDCYLEINAGAGGTESCDWANMLLRMYLMWASSKGYKTEIIEETKGEEVGIKSITVAIHGINSYGWLKSESGVHRLVRISPFDSNAKRHTSFASVFVSPVIDDNINIEISESDLRIDTFKASGKGGQHVNTTDSAVRITHLPTNTVAASQQQRSQHKNKDQAMKMLKSKLYELELQKRTAEKAQAEGSKTDIGWGHQIRSYVLQPYQMIKDLRTGVEIGNAKSVLDGNIDAFLEASLSNKI